MADLTVTTEQWLERAAEAEDSLDFDVCVARGLPFFAASIDRAETARTMMFGDWQSGRAAAYLAGLKKYASTRTDLENNGQPTLSAHRQAKEAAMSTYNRVKAGGVA
jgi:hypothetical protein